MALILFLAFLIFTVTVLYRGIQSPAWEIGAVVYLVSATCIIGMPWLPTLLAWVIVAAIFALSHLIPLRSWIAGKLYVQAVHSVPKLSSTEEEALNAGDTWIEKDIFTGALDWQKLAAISSELSPEEVSFLANETESLCAMLDDWSINQAGDLPESIWTFLKEKGFFGIVIAKQYGGKGFSARAHSDIVMKIASRSGVAAVTVMVPNSLGPGELLHYYGSDAQKKQFLPRLAQGLDIPCFALTEPGAGSDATSLQTEAVVTEATINGKKTLNLVINNLNKRWITLAPIATLIGLAVNLKDPNGLLKGIGKEGITCLLIPRATKNLIIGNRHLPANQPFMNGTIRGNNIVVSIDAIIGGQEKAGHGWQMLVECLSIGRSISLPALATATSSIAYLTTGAFARIRRQFNVEIGNFEGVGEKLAEIAGLSYLINSTRLLTIAAVNQHKKPSVASAITKYFNTELARVVVNNAMDVHAGRAVVAGPRNYLSSCYFSLPISITVEGSNIMSRNLLIFGQGSMACHPFIRDEFYAVAREDKLAFNQLLWKHIGYFLKNFTKTVVTTWTGGWFITAPRGKMHRQYQRLARLSYAYAWFADLALIYMGGELKRKERLSARLADGLSYLYMAMAALRNCQNNEENVSQEVHANWAVSYCYHHAQKSLLGLCRNFPSVLLGTVMRLVAFPFGQTMQNPSDVVDKNLSALMSTNNSYRDSLKKEIFLSGNAEEAIEKMENAFQLIEANGPLAAKVADLRRYSFAALKEKLAEKVEKGELSADEMARLVSVERARWDAIQVDEFDFEAMKAKMFDSVTNEIANPLD